MGDEEAIRALSFAEQSSRGLARAVRLFVMNMRS